MWSVHDVRYSNGLVLRTVEATGNIVLEGTMGRSCSVILWQCLCETARAHLWRGTDHGCIWAWVEQDSATRSLTEYCGILSCARHGF